MNERIEHLIKKKKDIYYKEQKESDKYHERLAVKLSDPKTAPKTQLSILKTFVNGSKIPLILPLVVNSEFVADFLAKANLFNDFFREQCGLITNDNSLPNNQTIETATRLSGIKIDTDTIIKLRPLDPTKGCDGISIHMLKFCATSI